MKIVMNDGRKIFLSTIQSRDVLPDGLFTSRRPAIHVAETSYPVWKMAGTLPRTERGYGSTMDAAIANLYERLEDAGELDHNDVPCESCGLGYRILSMTHSYMEHRDGCDNKKEKDEVHRESPL